MNGAKRIVITIVLSLCIAFLLTMVPQWGTSDSGLMSVFRMNKAQAISDQNVVDFVGKMQLKLRLRKVEVNRSIISIDLSLNAASSKADILGDLIEVPQYMFAGSTNINQVLIRILDSGTDGGSGNGALIVALDARRENWMSGGDKRSSATSDELAQYIASHYYVTYTPKWKDRFGTAF
jgi:hypothetical protein